jgi:hypothetical protein
VGIAGVLIPDSWGDDFRKGKHVFQFVGLLWADEPAWKMEVELARIASFPAKELFTFRVGAAPGQPDYQPFTFATNINGIQLKFRGESDPLGRLPDGSYGCRDSERSFTFDIEPHEKVSMHLLEVRDDGGRKADGSTTLDSNGRWCVRVKTPATRALSTLSSPCRRRVLWNSWWTRGQTS